MSNRWRWVLVVVVLAVAAAVAIWPRNAPQTPAAAPSPDLAASRTKAALKACPQPLGGAGPEKFKGVQLECLGDGKPVDLAAMLAGRAALINFWEPWCEPCRTELPVLEQYAGQQGAAVVLTVLAPDRSDAASGLDLLTSLGMHLPTVYDQSASVAKLLGKPNVLPVSYVVDTDGTVTRVAKPPVFETADQVRQAIQQHGNGVAAG